MRDLTTTEGTWREAIARIAISRNGLLGDTMAAVPSLNALRSAFPAARIELIYETVPGSGYVTARDVLDGSGLVDAFHPLPSHVPAASRALAIGALFLRLRRPRRDLGIVLEEERFPARRKRFLALCGARRVLGPEGRAATMPRDEAGRLLPSESIADVLLSSLAPLGMRLPGPGRGSMDLHISDAEHAEAERWLGEKGPRDASRPLIAIGLWSNMACKRWPFERYEEVVRALVLDAAAFPVVLGAAGERAIAERFIGRVGGGAAAAGELGIRQGVALLSRCSLYLGNDSGPMHMAACAGIRCVAVFSSRDRAGLWHPYGTGHRVFRTPVECEGCMLRDCRLERMRCILAISPAEVLAACREALRERRGSCLRSPSWTSAT